MKRLTIKALIKELEEVDNNLDVAILSCDGEIHSIYAIAVIGTPPFVVIQEATLSEDKEEEAVQKSLEHIRKTSV